MRAASSRTALAAATGLLYTKQNVAFMRADPPKAPETPYSDDVVAHSWLELMDILQWNVWDESKNQYQSPFIYRGMDNAAWEPLTSLQRLGHEGKTEDVVELGILRAFTNYAHSSLPANASTFEWITLAQHHGCPTRILDFSYSPLVALYFATKDVALDHVDGIIWCVHPRACLEAAPTYRDRYSAWHQTTGSETYYQVARIKQLESVLTLGSGISPDSLTTRECFELLKGLGDSLVFVEPPHIDSRVRGQSHVFAIASESGRRIGDWLRDHDGHNVLRRIIIPSHKKKEFREKLRLFGVDDWRMFPDLDGLSKWITHHYEPFEKLPPQSSPPPTPEKSVYDLEVDVSQSPKAPETRKSALLIIDVQNDFITGSLANPAPDVAQIVSTINDIRDTFDVVAVSYDWHPKEHCSFVESVNDGLVPIEEYDRIPFLPFQEVTLRADRDRASHVQTLYPRHAVQHTLGSCCHQELVLKSSDLVVRKGTRPNIDSYSAFFDNCKAHDTGLTAMLKEAGVTDVYCVGLVFDICVAFTALHGAEQGFRTYVIEDACRPLSTEKVESTKQTLREAGVQVLSSSEALARLSGGREQPPWKLKQFKQQGEATQLPVLAEGKPSRVDVVSSRSGPTGTPNETPNASLNGRERVVPGRWDEWVRSSKKPPEGARSSPSRPSEPQQVISTNAAAVNADLTGAPSSTACTSDQSEALRGEVALLKERLSHAEQLATSEKLAAAKLLEANVKAASSEAELRTLRQSNDDERRLRLQQDSKMEEVIAKNTAHFRSMAAMSAFLLHQVDNRHLNVTQTTPDVAPLHELLKAMESSAR